MHFAKGANGSEMCPNVSFWKEVPVLVKVIIFNTVDLDLFD